jgi:pyruvate kinase
LEDLKIGDKIAIESGLLTVEVKGVTADYLLVEAQNACSIGSRRHMNFPGIKLRLPGLTEKDKKDLKF